CARSQQSSIASITRFRPAIAKSANRSTAEESRTEIQLYKRAVLTTVRAGERGALQHHPPRLNAAKKQQDDDHEKDDSDSADRVRAPFPSLRPARQCSEKSKDQDQNHDQYSSQHGAPLFP